MFTKAIEILGKQRSILSQYKRVAKAFPPKRRVEGLSWSHHHKACGAPQADRAEILSIAMEENLSTREVERLAKRRKQEVIDEPFQVEAVNDLWDLRDAGNKFSCIYADPPWDYGDDPDNPDTRTGNAKTHYPTMDTDSLMELPVEWLCEDNCHLHLWCTPYTYEDAMWCLESWGFRYTGSMFVWTKPQMGCGYYWRNSHEMMLLGVRGSLPFNALNVPSWLTADRTHHSAKPSEVRQLIEKVSPGPYLELFGREKHPNWTVFGNQITA